MSTIVSIQARMGSQRLPGKVMLSMGDKRVLERTVNRCDAATLPDDVVVTVGDEECNKMITQWCERNQIRYSEGPEEELLTRHRKVAKQTNADSLVRVTADSPFLPADEIDRLIEEHSSHRYDYTTNFDEASPVGTIVDVIETEILDTLFDNGESHPVQRLRENDGTFDVNVSPSPELREIAEANLEVNTPEDYWRLTDALNRVGADTREMGRWLTDT